MAGKGKGFYGVCDFGDVLILGTYGSGIYYMDKSTSEIRKGELVGVGESCVVDGEAVELGGKDAEVASFDASICKNITKVSETKAVAAIVYNKNNSDHYDRNHLDIVESEDGMRWVLKSRIYGTIGDSAEKRQSISTNANVVFANGTYFAAARRAIFKSADLVNWTSVDLPGELYYTTSAHNLVVKSQDSGKVFAFVDGTSGRPIRVFAYDLASDRVEEVNSILPSNSTPTAVWCSYVDGQKIIICFQGSSENYGRVATTTDDFATFRLNELKCANIPRGIAKCKDFYVMCGYQGGLFVSTTGLEWQLVSDETRRNPEIKNIEGVVAIDGTNEFYYVVRQNADDAAFVCRVRLFVDELAFNGLSYVSNEVVPYVNKETDRKIDGVGRRIDQVETRISEIEKYKGPSFDFVLDLSGKTGTYRFETKGNMVPAGEACYVDWGDGTYSEFPAQNGEIGRISHDYMTGMPSIDYSAVKCKVYGITRIKAHAFSGMSELAAFNPRKELAHLDNNVFSNTKLKELDLSDSGVAEISTGVFYSSQLSAINLKNSSYKTINRGCFGRCGNLTSVVIPENVVEFKTDRAEGAFDNCANLELVYFPNRSKEEVKSIPGVMSAFTNCSPNLKIMWNKQDPASGKSDYGTDLYSNLSV